MIGVWRRRRLELELAKRQRELEEQRVRDRSVELWDQLEEATVELIEQRVRGLFASKRAESDRHGPVVAVDVPRMDLTLDFHRDHA